MQPTVIMTNRSGDLSTRNRTVRLTIKVESRLALLPVENIMTHVTVTVGLSSYFDVIIHFDC